MATISRDPDQYLKKKTVKGFGGGGNRQVQHFVIPYLGEDRAFTELENVGFPERGKTVGRAGGGRGLRVGHGCFVLVVRVRASNGAVRVKRRPPAWQGTAGVFQFGDFPLWPFLV